MFAHCFFFSFFKLCQFQFCFRKLTTIIIIFFIDLQQYSGESCPSAGTISLPQLPQSNRSGAQSNDAKAQYRSGEQGHGYAVWMVDYVHQTHDNRRHLNDTCRFLFLYIIFSFLGSLFFAIIITNMNTFCANNQRMNKRTMVQDGKCHVFRLGAILIPCASR